MENIHKPKPRKRNSGRRKRPKKKIYPFELKLKGVKLYLEEGFSASLIKAETGLSPSNIYRWVNIYESEGEEGLKDQRSSNGMRKLPEAVRKRIIEEKKKDPSKGSKKISQFLRRILFLKASPETVRKTLKKEGLVEKPKAKSRKKNISKPRFFERSTPNQLWQSDIFMFRAGGKYTYLIGYIDDYSRYITGLGLFHSQTAENVIEVYRRAAAEYKPPREMLTDNGRQYTSWRGKTRFEAEMAKDKIHHFKSQPHHPMTLGKIERFWQTIYNEFLIRARFESFEDARDRIQQWVKYYNHRRPHQGIGGLCPADRYFEISTELKKTIEHGIAENVLELALRGKPREPFYMVGRMDGQSVVLQASKGKLTLSVDDKDTGETRELTYPLTNKGEEHEKEQSEKTGNPEEGTTESETLSERNITPTFGEGENKSSSVHMDGAQKTRRDMPGDEYKSTTHPQLAGPGTQGNDAGAGTQAQPGEGSGTSPQATEVPGETHILETGERGYEYPPGEQVAENTEHQDVAESIFNVTQPQERRVPEHEEQGRQSQEARTDNSESEFGRDNGHPGSRATGYIQKELPPVGEAGAGWNVEGPGRAGGWSTSNTSGQGEGNPEEESRGFGEGIERSQAIEDGTETFPRLGTPESKRSEEEKPE